VSLIRAALDEEDAVMAVRPDDIPRTTPRPDIVFVGWGAGIEDWRDSDEDRRLRATTATAMLLTRIHKALSFHDCPILVIADKGDVEDAQSTTRFGSSGILQTPIEPDRLKETIAEKLKPVGKDSRIDARLVNPFAEAAVHVLKKMAKIEATRNGILLKKDYRLLGEISAVLTVSGKSIEGAVGITFESELARQVVANAWDRPTNGLSLEEVNDGLGELVNVISGRATTSLSNEVGSNFTLSLPTIVTGFGNEISHRPGAPCLVIIFEALKNPFAVQIALSPPKD